MRASPDDGSGAQLSPPPASRTGGTSSQLALEDGGAMVPNEWALAQIQRLQLPQGGGTGGTLSLGLPVALPPEETLRQISRVGAQPEEEMCARIDKGFERVVHSLDRGVEVQARAQAQVDLDKQTTKGTFASIGPEDEKLLAFLRALTSSKSSWCQVRREKPPSSLSNGKPPRERERLAIWATRAA